MGLFGRLKASYNSGVEAQEKDEERERARQLYKENLERRKREREEAEEADDARRNPNRIAKNIGRLAKKTEKPRKAIGGFVSKVGGEFVKSASAAAKPRPRKRTETVKTTTSGRRLRQPQGMVEPQGMVARATQQRSYLKGSGRNPFDSTSDQRPDPFGILTPVRNKDPFGITTRRESHYDPFNPPEVKSRSKRIKTIKIK